jgi:tripartite-type tricarboxylate transporter receptor subunit TctC
MILQRPTLNRRRLLLAAAALLAPALTASRAGAEGAFPAKPVRLIVPEPPGGGNDTLARAIAQNLGGRLGQPVIVDNRAGASGMIAAEEVKRAAPDGYTLFLGQTQTLAVNPRLYAHLPYDPTTDFAPISLIAAIPLVLLVNPSVPANSLKELVALATAHPGTLNFASAGNGSGSHLAGALFKSVTHIDIAHVPYKGTGPALADLLAGQVQIFFSTLPSAVPYVRAGTVRALAVTGAARVPALPQVPTAREAGLAGFEVALHYGILAPAKTPAEIVGGLNQALHQTMQDPPLVQRFDSMGIVPLSSTPDGFARDIASEQAKWGEMVRLSGAHVE